MAKKWVKVGPVSQVLPALALAWLKDHPGEWSATDIAKVVTIPHKRSKMLTRARVIRESFKDNYSVLERIVTRRYGDKEWEYEVTLYSWKEEEHVTE